MVYGVDEMLELYWVQVKLEFGRHRGYKFNQNKKYRMTKESQIKTLLNLRNFYNLAFWVQNICLT